MASKETTFSLVNDWLEKNKNSVAGSGRIELRFSEELPKTLYYKTDVGSIPRGAHSESYPIPKYKNNPNWSKHIIGCYWCGRDRTTVNGICCSKECIYYFHEWCVERVKLFQEWRFCKLPGCDLSPTDANHVCCSRSHNIEYDKMFRFIDKIQLHDLVTKGPSWYNCEYSFAPSKPIAEKAVRDLAKQMKSNLIHYTDVGPIPRSYKTAEHSTSHFSKHENWLTDIRGCYLCGESVTDGCEYLCSYKCYRVFNEWCRRKVLKERGIKYCVYPGCEKVIERQYSFCGQYHLERRDKYLESYEYSLLLQKGPHWYNNTPSDTNSEDTGESNRLSTSDITELNTQNTINISQHSQHSAVVNPFKRHLVFSEILTDWLYKCSDIGPIPRSLIRYPEVSVMNKLTKSNWNTYIPMCYWCCGDDVTNTKGIACSEKCFFLFSEWCHERYYNSKSRRICKICGCLRFFGGDACYPHSTEYSFYSKYTHLLKTSDYALGPQWYSDTKLSHIDFYDKEDPFYEFTNFYPCPRLNLDAKEWKTTEHYYQAQKFFGTPHVEYVRKLDNPRSAFEYTRRPEVQRRIRPDWAKVKEEFMLKAVKAKFNQNQELGQLLVRTGDVKLFEHTRNDKFWGDGGDRRGENKLGMILMQVRFDLHAKCPFFPSRLCRIQESGSNSVSNPDQNEAPPQKASFEDSKESGIQTLLTFGVNNEDTNLVQNGGTNTNQQNLSLFPPTHPPQTNTSSSSLQPSALPFEYSNANSERISNSNKPPCYPSTNPFANLIHEGSSKITDIVSEPLSTKTEEISGITPGQKLGYSMKHDLPEDYNGPFDLIHLGSVEMGTGQNENSPQVVSLEDSKEEKSIENSSTNVVTTLSDKPVIDMCDETGYGSFADISSSTPGQKLEYSAKHDLPEDYHSPFGPNNLDSVEMETGESENPPQVVSSSDRQHNTDSDPIQSEHTSIVGEDDSSMETSQIEDSRDKDNPEPSNTRLITESKSDSNGLPRTEPHQRYDESNRFAKHLDDKSHVSASDTESS